MTDYEFLKRCMAIGLTENEARKQLAKAKIAGHQAGDPYALAWIHEGASAKNQRLFALSLERFEDTQRKYVGGIARALQEQATPKLEAAVSKAVGQALVSPTQVALSAARTLLLVVFISKLTFLWGVSVSAIDDAFWQEMASSQNATAWESYLRTNIEALEQYTGCLQSTSLHDSDDKGVYCHSKVYVDQTVYSSPVGHPINRYLWLLYFLAGVLAALFAVVFARPLREKWKALVRTIRDVAL